MRRLRKPDERVTTDPRDWGICIDRGVSTVQTAVFALRQSVVPDHRHGIRRSYYYLP
jgi:hypothetical protein